MTTPLIKISVDKTIVKCYTVDNVDFLLTIETKTKFTGKITLEINQGGVARIEKHEVLK